MEVARRRRAREAALQMLYQGEIGRTGASEAIATYWPAHDPDREVADEAREFANALVRGTSSRLEEIDALLTAHTQNWRLARMAVLDRLILRMAIYELLADEGTPSKVVINEALELARTYSGEEAVAFVNGVLDAVRKQLEAKQPRPDDVH
jgi:transcription antitermination protein NusB